MMIYAYVGGVALMPVSDLAFQVGIFLLQAPHSLQVACQAVIQALHQLLFIAVEDSIIMPAIASNKSWPKGGMWWTEGRQTAPKP